MCNSIRPLAQFCFFKNIYSTCKEHLREMWGGLKTLIFQFLCLSCFALKLKCREEKRVVFPNTSLIKNCSLKKFGVHIVKLGSQTLFVMLSNVGEEGTGKGYKLSFSTTCSITSSKCHRMLQHTLCYVFRHDSERYVYILVVDSYK